MLWTADTVMYRGESMYAAYSGDTLIWAKISATEATTIDTSSTYIIRAGNKIAVTDDLKYSTGVYQDTSSIALQDATFDSNGNLLGPIPSNAFTFELVNNGTDFYKLLSGGYYFAMRNPHLQTSDIYNMYMTSSIYLSDIKSVYIKKELIQEDKVTRNVNYYNMYFIINSGGSSTYSSYGKNWGYDSNHILFKFISNVQNPGLIPRLYKVL